MNLIDSSFLLDSLLFDSQSQAEAGATMMTVDRDFTFPGTTIDIPEDGITIKHGEQEICKVDPCDIEVVTDESGVMLYINLPLTEKNKQWLRKYAPVVGTGRHDPLKMDCSTSV